MKKSCWTGYVAKGMKMKNGKKVPNCVPVSEHNRQPNYYKKIFFILESIYSDPDGTGYKRNILTAAVVNPKNPKQGSAFLTPRTGGAFTGLGLQSAVTTFGDSENPKVMEIPKSPKGSAIRNKAAKYARSARSAHLFMQKLKGRLIPHPFKKQHPNTLVTPEMHQKILNRAARNN